MKTKDSKPPETKKLEPSTPPVVIALPNTTEQKMRAIVSISAAIADVAKALNSVHTEVTVSHNVIVASSDHPAVSILGQN